MSHEGYHEPVALLSQSTIDLHRALISLQEELEAIDWYQQRADACKDESLKSVMLHNRNEEVEHAMMTLEWIRRNDPKFDENAKLYLFKTVPILEIEEQEKLKAGGGTPGAEAPAVQGSLGIGSLRSL